MSRLTITQRWFLSGLFYGAGLGVLAGAAIWKLAS